MNEKIDGEPMKVDGKTFLDGKREMEIDEPMADYVKNVVVSAYCDNDPISLDSAAHMLTMMGKDT